MRTDEERMELIRKRTGEIKREECRKKQRLLGLGCTVVCLVMIIGLGLVMPDMMQKAASSGTVVHNSGAASLIGSSSALGYIMVGILSFVLGAAVTTLMFYMRKNDDELPEEGV